ncbi:hypothetical protein MKW94_030287, partial [Papaver nudicaule]|nr:hypothetical protein [Papaver nudicaule]
DVLLLLDLLSSTNLRILQSRLQEKWVWKTETTVDQSEGRLFFYTIFRWLRESKANSSFKHSIVPESKCTCLPSPGPRKNMELDDCNL